MAGYKAPDDIFINATAINNQIKDQREKYQEKKSSSRR